MSSTEILMSRMIGLPLKTSGRAVISLEEIVACGGHVGAPVLLIGWMWVLCASVVNCWGV